MIAGADVFVERIDDIARERRVKRFAVLGADFVKNGRKSHHAAPTFVNRDVSFARSPLACTRCL